VIDEFEIMKFIEDSEEHPAMEDLVKKFNVNELKLEELTMFLKALLVCVEGATILYDSKHDAWLRLVKRRKNDFIKL